MPGAPLNIHASNITSTTIFLTWSPPSVSERSAGQNILGYHIICSSLTSVLGSYGNITAHKDIHNAIIAPVHPFTAYNCCVAADSSYGRGKLACLRATTCRCNGMIIKF